MDKNTIISAVAVAGTLFVGTIWYFADGQFMLAKHTVAQEFRDPGSVQFRNLRRLSNGGVCGEVNARNAYGAYVGHKGFYYSGSEYGPGIVYFPDSSVEIIRQRYYEHCSRPNT
jgi:hypothetical protein